MKCHRRNLQHRQQKKKSIYHFYKRFAARKRAALTHIQMYAHTHTDGERENEMKKRHAVKHLAQNRFKNTLCDTMNSTFDVYLNAKFNGSCCFQQIRFEFQMNVNNSFRAHVPCHRRI